MATKTVEELFIELEGLIRLQVKLRGLSVIGMKIVLNKIKECKDAYKEEKGKPV